MCKMSKVATLSGFKEFYVIFMKFWQNARYITIPNFIIYLLLRHKLPKFPVTLYHNERDLARVKR